MQVVGTPAVWWHRALIAWIIVFTGATVFSLSQLRGFAHENKQRIVEIQENRVASCKQTYEGIRDVFKPFFPPPPRTKPQQANLDKFNGTIDKLKRRCVTQTTAGVETGGNP